MSDPNLALEVQGMHKRFGSHEVLKGIDLVAHTGNVISIIGSSGSGKSTFLRCINLLETPDAGDVFLHGELIRMKALRDGSRRSQLQRMRAKLSMVFQSFNLWSHKTILENIIEAPVHVLGKPKREATEQADALLQKVGMYDRRDYYPSQISGGQQQRAAIARALAMEPEVMLFDEPTSALDPELCGEVLQVMRGLAEEGRTMLVVTHEMGFARDVSSHVMFLHDGSVEAFGPAKAVFDNPSSQRMRQFIGHEQ